MMTCMNKAGQSLKWVLLDLINRCDDLRSFKQIHALLLTSALVANDLVVTKAASFLGKRVTDVHYPPNFLRQFDWSVSSFPCNLMISGYASGHLPWVAILIYRWTVRNGFVPDVYTVPAVLKSCAKFSGIGEVRQFHSVAVKTGLWCDIYVQNTLVHVYSICGDNVGAGKVFDDMLVRDVVSWTGLISGYVKAGLFDDAITLFLRMDVEPNVATFVSILGACGKLGCLNLGKGIHGLVFKSLYGEELVVCNAMLDMYMKCESVTDARQMFDEIPEKDIISWTSMISGLVQCQCPKESLDLFSQMQGLGFEHDEVILTSVLSACASLGLLDYGRWVHEYINGCRIKWDVHIGTALVDMYAKCGCIEMARHIFNGIPSKNIRTWNAYIGGLAINGYGKEALKQFEDLIESGTRPNEVTFLAVFTACCHSGLVDEGQKYFNDMTSPRFNLSPWLEHYGCMVDLLCRAGLVGEAVELIKIMPMPPDVQILGALLSACTTYGNVGFTQEMLKSLQNFEFQDSGIYVLLSNLYANDKKWAEVRSVRRLMKQKGISKAPGSSLIRVDVTLSRAAIIGMALGALGIILMILLPVSDHIILHLLSLMDLLTNQLVILNVNMALHVYDDIMRMTENLSEKYIIGYGASSTVYKCALKNCKPVAVKKLYSHYPHFLKEFETELETDGSIKHGIWSVSKATRCLGLETFSFMTTWKMAISGIIYMDLPRRKGLIGIFV